VTAERLRIGKIQTNMITLIDTFNGRSLSRHRTLENAVLAQRRHDAAVKRNNGPGSYVTYGFEADGEPVGWDEIEAVKMEIEGRR
jgi:hypothetical protein